MRKLEQFFFRYFSQSTQFSEDAWLRWAFYTFLFVLVAGGILNENLGAPIIAKIFFFSFAGIFTTFGILWIIVWFYHNWRIYHEKK